MSGQAIPSSEATLLRHRAAGNPNAWWTASLLLAIFLTVATWWLSKAVPQWNKQLRVLEFPVYAVGLGLLASGIVSLLGVRERLAAHFRTEFFLKTPWRPRSIRSSPWRWRDCSSGEGRGAGRREKALRPRQL